MIGNSNEETNFPYKLLLTDRLISELPKAFANNSSPYNQEDFLIDLSDH